MVKIRLKRIGKRKNAFYRIVAADSRVAGNKMYIDLLGTYDPATKEIKLDTEKAYDWLKKGAKPTDTARILLSSEGVMQRLHNEKYGTKKSKPVE